MTYFVKHVLTTRYHDANHHEQKIQEALDTLGEKDEIYSVQHSSHSQGHAAQDREYSTVIIYRRYGGE